jgi:hypothetical protein
LIGCCAITNNSHQTRAKLIQRFGLTAPGTLEVAGQGHGREAWNQRQTETGLNKEILDTQSAAFPTMCPKE